MYFEEELRLLLLSRHTLMYVVTDEENRLEFTIRQIAGIKLGMSLYTWDFIDGYSLNPNCIYEAKRNPLAALEFIDTTESTKPQVFLLKDFHVFMQDVSITRKLKNINQNLKRTGLYIIISASDIQIPVLLQKAFTVLNFPLPNIREINLELNRLFSVMSIDLKVDREDLVLAFRGFSIERIRKSISKLISSQKPIRQIYQNILEEKKQLIQQTDLLDFYPVNNNLEDIGGLANLKDWLKKRSCCFSKQAQNYGLPLPRGILLVGVQGTGKSISAKAISKQWNIPLLRLDVGKIFGGLVGESEERMRKMIRIAEQSAPCVLWIDEIDKIFTRLTSNSDSGTSNRVLSSLLTWLSEKDSQVFVAATANNVLSLPSEMLRKGRFDEIFFLDLPNIKERYNIFEIHLKKMRPLTWRNYNIKYLSQRTDNFSGAEIKQLIVEAMYNAFYEQRDFSTYDVITSIENVIPLAVTDQSAVNILQEWAKLGKVRLASKSI
uniref:Uncharacterized AAA domain-containing protein ycf46 n=1 Tax=Schizymenia dubyi TaxID=38368 RepID=A0A1C9C9E2_9FLOR|nr:hypothetical protein Schiz_105 [Schizymenia dubyi]AOM64988.1 hypothetical protein Schiz_105 [Schizymenia dubyi]